MITLFHYLVLASILFCIGLYGVLTRRNAVAVLMSLELMFNAVNINLVAFSHYRPELEGIAGLNFSLFIIAVAACEATVGVALVLSLYRNQKDIDLDKATQLRL